MMTDKRLLVIDLMPILYRGYFVFLNKPRRTASGCNTSALLLFATTLEQLIRDWKPTHLAVATESFSPTFRHRLYPAYKAQREKMPEDIAAAIVQVQELAAAWGISILRAEGFEADDVLGTLATRGAKEGFDVLIASPDKDLGQLIGPKVSLIRPGENVRITEQDLCEHWGIATPEQLIDYLALAGDASDNIPGIQGIGPKTATRLISTYGSLEALLEHAHEVPGKLGATLRANPEAARISKQLVTIVRDVPLEVSWEMLELRPPVLETLAPVLLKYELHTVANRLGIAASASQTQFFGGGEAFKAPVVEEHTAYQTLADVPHEYRLVTTEAERLALAEELLRADLVAIDSETTGLNPREDRAVGLSFATAPGRAWYLPLPEWEAERRAVLQPFLPFFASERIAKVGHNLKFDRAVLAHLGVTLGGPLHDTLLAHYLLDATDRHDLDHVAKAELNYAPIPITDLLGKQINKTMDALSPEAVCDYAAEDADVALRLWQALRPQLEEKNLITLLETCEEPLVGVLMGMEHEGVRLDVAALKRFRYELEGEVIRLELAIREYTGAGINLASPKQVGEFLFGELKLDPSVKRTPRGQFPTNEELLLKLRDRHPVVDLLLDWRACVKLKNTYVDKLPDHISPADGRIHTTFNQTFTDTGRLSSSDPNLQNVPVRTDRGQRIRAAFVARGPGWTLLSADYSQVELRLMASMSGDERLVSAFLRGEDIHAQTASVVYGVPLESVTAHQRTSCKMVNFGIIYGISAFGLALRLRIPRKEAQDLIDAYFEKYPAVKAYMDRSIESARTKGYAETLFGRRRAVPEITSRNASTRGAAERIAVNMPIQGSAADIIKLAMVRIDRELRARHLRTRLILQIHDELLFDVPEEEVEQVKPLVREAMEQVVSLAVPLSVSIGVGADWLSAH